MDTHGPTTDAWARQLSEHAADRKLYGPPSKFSCLRNRSKPLPHTWQAFKVWNIITLRWNVLMLVDPSNGALQPRSQSTFCLDREGGLHSHALLQHPNHRNKGDDAWRTSCSEKWDGGYNPAIFQWTNLVLCGSGNFIQLFANKKDSFTWNWRLKS